MKRGNHCCNFTMIALFCFSVEIFMDIAELFVGNVGIKLRGGHLIALSSSIAYHINMEELKEIKGKITPIFKDYPEIKLVYFFGSKARGEGGPLSDYDFAVYTEKKGVKKTFDLKFSLQDKISRALKTDKVDMVMLDITESPELKFNVIKEGKLIYEVEPYKVIIEPKILNEYFDFHSLLLRHGLTRA